MTDLKWKRVDGVCYAGIKPYQGRTRWVSMKTSSLTEAKRRAGEAKLFKMQAVESANALTNEVFARIRDTEPSPVVSAAIDRFVQSLIDSGSPSATYSKFRSMLLAWMRDYDTANIQVCHLKQEHFTKYFNPEDGTKLKTLELRRISCVKLMDYCANQSWSSGNQAKSVGIDKTKLTQAELLTKSHPPITKEEFDKLLATSAHDPFWYFAILFAWEHGARIGDICLLEKVNVADNILRLITRKTGTYINVPLTNPVVALLDKLEAPVNEKESRFIFPLQRAEYTLYGASSLSKQFRKICDKCGVTGKSFHGFRTAFINRTYAEKHVSILGEMSRELAKQHTASSVGHRGTGATDIYLRAGGSIS